MTLLQLLHREEQVLHSALVQHLQTAGIVLVTLVILIGLILGAFVAAEMHQFNP